eukprot:SAG25_NODE_142_length_14075_cov_38.666070_3_plen_47_part_00
MAGDGTGQEQVIHSPLFAAQFLEATTQRMELRAPQHVLQHDVAFPL